jgi:hypothetical protein
VATQTGPASERREDVQRPYPDRVATWRCPELKEKAEGVAEVRHGVMRRSLELAG